jgi:hypothetical protein
MAGRPIGGSTCFAISRKIPSVKRCVWPQMPIRMMGFTALIVFQEGDVVEVRMRHAIQFGPLVHQALLEQVETGHAAMNKAETVHYVVIGPWFLRACAPSSIAAPMSCSAMPQPAELPPGMTTRCCGIGLPEVGILES